MGLQQPLRRPAHLHGQAGHLSAATIETLTDFASPHLGALLVESEDAGLRLVRNLVDEWASGKNRFDKPGEVVLGAWLGGRLVGVCGLNVDPHVADARVGRVRHLYVLVASRRLGIARQLTARIIAAAQGRFDTLRLHTTNPAAARLYESLGFRPGTASHCTHLLPLAPAR